MKAFLHHQNLRRRYLPATTVQPRQLEGGFVGLRARIAEERLLHTGQRAQALSKSLLPVDTEHVGGVQQHSRLLGDDGGDLRVGVAQAGDRDTGDGIQMLRALFVPKPRTVAAHEGNRLTGVGAHQVGMGVLHDDDSKGIRKRHAQLCVIHGLLVWRAAYAGASGTSPGQ